MWKMILESLASVSKKLMSFFKTDWRYLSRKRAVCLSPVCIQNATPEMNISIVNLRKSGKNEIENYAAQVRLQIQKAYLSMPIPKQQVQGRPSKEHAADKWIQYLIWKLEYQHPKTMIQNKQAVLWSGEKRDLRWKLGIGRMKQKKAWSVLVSTSAIWRQ